VSLSDRARRPHHAFCRAPARLGDRRERGVRRRRGGNTERQQRSGGRRSGRRIRRHRRPGRSPTRCFAGEGYPISIGDGGAAIEALVHLSVLTDPTAGNEFGLEAAGTLDGEPIVTLGAGVRLTAREAIANGVDPFAAFDVLYAYELRLPMFDGSIGDSEYRDEGSPIDSGAGAVPC